MKLFSTFWHLALLSTLTSCTQESTSLETQKWFDLHLVSTDLPLEPAPRWGTPAMADFDRDGDLDFALSVTRGPLLWFEYLGDHQWQKHEIGEMPTGQLGGAAFDVDGDGWPDIVAGGVWFRNSRKPSELPFERRLYDPGINREIHDLVFADVSDDGRKDLVAMGDAEGCFWYELPADPLQDTIWKKNVITMEVLNDRADIHGGFFPGGVGDVDMDGDNDIVLVGRWYRNEGEGKNWSRQFLPYGSAGYWGLSGRSWIVDMDKDGDNDIVMVGCDQVDSRGAWLENNGRDNPRFTVRLLPLTAPGRRGSFHSLWVADFDLDGDPDIFTMEQEDDQILPQEATMRAFLWENADGKGGQFLEHVVLDQNIGGHDVQFGDADGDGDLDAYFKVWEALPSNAYGGKPHVNFLENRSARKEN